MPAEALATFQGDVIRAVVDALTTGTLPPISEIARALGPQVAAGHLRLWSAEPDAEALFSQVGAAGSLGARPDGSDFVELVTQNAGENKIDWYLRRSLAYAPTFDPATGALTATATVTLTNTIPADFISYRSPRGWSKRITSYIKGETGGPTKPGESALRLTIYSPHAPVGVTDADGRSLPVNIGREKGLYAVTVLVELPPQAQATVRFELAGTLPPSSGSYHLQVGRQPAVAPDAVRVTMVGGPGWVLSDPADSVRDLPAETDVTFETRLERR